MKWLVVALALACAKKPPVPILNYHAVGGPELSDAQFAAELDQLKEPTLLLSEYASGKKGVVLTFDDGTADALTHVLPALQKRGMRADFFVSTGLVGQPGYLTWDGVRALEKAGMEIGSHGVTHARLPDLPVAQAREELVESRKTLERELGHPVVLLAYPYNSVRGEVERLAREAGYRIAVAGPVHGSDDPLALARSPAH